LVAGVQELLRASLQATMSRLAMPICITAYTTDPEAAVAAAEVAAGIFCATQAPDVAPPPQWTGDALLHARRGLAHPCADDGFVLMVMRRSFVSTMHVTPEYVHILYADGVVVIVL
jgi:hypothetical protein